MGKLGYQDVFQKRTFWKEISNQYKGKFSIIHTKGSVLERFKLVIPYEKINIEISESDARPLKFSFETKFQKTFEFNISQEDYINKLSKFFGKKELQVKNEEFDNRYFLSSKYEFLFKEFLSNSELINKMNKLNVYMMNCTYDKKKNKHTFLSVFNYTVNKKESLNEIIQLHFLIIKRLISIKLIELKDN